MAEERRKGAPDRRRTREAKQPNTGGQPVGNEQQRVDNSNASPALEAAEQLDESIRARQQEERGEVF
jgi:hypothetical protein